MISIAGYIIHAKMRHNHNIDTYYAQRQKDKRKVLLKIPGNDAAPSENFAILQHEFHLLKMIETPAIIKAYDFLQNTSVPALVLEGVRGELLSSYIAANPLQLDDFFNLSLQLVDIIGELHQRNIIHKQIKPSNIVIDPKRFSLKLVDLSASIKLTEESFNYLNLSEFKDSLAYISPEQTGRINRPVDYRTDFYSLGVTLYELLTNQLPFQTKDALELVHCHIAKKPITVLEIRRGIPTMLAAIIDKLLEKMPENRYSSIIGLKSDLLECQQRWLQENNKSEFFLGTNDVKDHLTISRNLYGREQQVLQLLEAFNRVSIGTKEIVLISGYSGIGKTSLVKEVHKPIVQHKGYYISGKFDQLQRSIPYSAIVTAFQNLVKQVLSESEERLVALKRQLVRALGNVGQVVIDVIPEVELIIGSQPAVPILSPADAQIRFTLVFQNFVRVFAQPEHPLVVFLDDLQWADNSSLNFIENLLQDRETNHLLLIGAYRDNEIDEYHPLQLCINNLNNNDIPYTSLTLQPLELNNIQQLIEDTLSGALEKIPSLVRGIYDKTQGNPFFINEFLKIIYQENILFFSYEQGSWQWDLAKIQQQSATDNVITLLTTKIHLLPKSTQEVLMLCSCLGHQFDFNTLLIVSGQTISQTASQLAQAIKANLIYPLEETYKTLGLVGLDDSVMELNVSSLHYRFAHDRIQQATYALIKEKDRPEIHLKIGRLLLKEKPLEEQDERIFEIMEHLNQGISLVDDIDERLLLAKYNYWAGLKAKSAAAYDAANEYLMSGVSLLDLENWNENYKLVFQLHKELAVCKYLVGDFAAADEYFSELLNRARNSLDSLEIYKLKIEMLSTMGLHTQALSMGIDALQNFGIKIPTKPNVIHILAAIYKIRFQLRKTKIANAYLPPMTDLKYKAIVDLITQLLNSAFITNQQLFVLLTCKNIILSLKYGYTDSTSMSLPVYAFILMHSLNLYDDAISFVTLYNRLKKEYGSSNFEGKNQFILGSFIEPYQKSIASCNKTVIKAFGLCCEGGDLVYSNYSNLALVFQAFTNAKNLAEIKKNIQASLTFMSRIKISDFINVAKFWDYWTQCLENPELVNVEQSGLFENDILQGKSKTELSFFYSSSTVLHLLLGHFEQAIDAGKNHELYSDYDKGMIIHFDGRFFYALALFFHLPEMAKNEQASSLKKLKQLRRFISKNTSWCPNNFKVHSLFIDSEFARLEHRQEQALALYEQTIEAALAHGLILIAALASERAGHYCVIHKIEKVAKLYLQNAHQYFKEWGATAKVQLLEEAYPSLHVEHHSSHKGTLSSQLLSQANTQELDMLAIFKFTQVISSEIRLDKLLQKFLIIVLENAGAQRSIILNKVDEQWVVEAEGNLDQQTIYLNNPIASDVSVTYPISILNYVQRTQKPIILNDAIQSELTFQDAYVQQEKPRSLLMMPLFYKGHLNRILYLENNSTSYTFTPNHLDSLQLLAAQAMTSLENAKLYYQATHDPLTGLANRNLLYDLFQQIAKQANRNQGRIALLFLDIDYFKVINDTLGHDNGDKLLIHVARTLNACLREGDVAARMGGMSLQLFSTIILLLSKSFP